MNHLWPGKVFTIPGLVLNYGGANIGGAHLMPVPPPKNLGCPNFGVGMPHARSGGDTLTMILNTCRSKMTPNYRMIVERYPKLNGVG